MSRWPIWALAYAALCGCQAATLSQDDCPAPTLCEDPGSDARLLPGPNARAVVTQADYRPLKPGCPSTLQVMAQVHRIAFQAVRPEEEMPDDATDPSDFVCAPPEAPLMRTERRPRDRDFAAR
jgi:hypothetical protein